MQFEVFVNGVLYKSLTAKKCGEVLSMLSREVKAGLVPGLDSSGNYDVKVTFNLEDSFGRLDGNKDGNISKEEFGNK